MITSSLPILSATILYYIFNEKKFIPKIIFNNIHDEKYANR